MRKIEVSAYYKSWYSMFLEEAEKLKLIYGDEIVEVHFIGSTSVPGLKAKPIIHIMPIVRDSNEVDEYNQQMQDIDLY